MSKYNYSRLALKAVCPNNDILLDDKGMPSIHVFIPKFRMCDVVEGGSNNVHPAFIVNDTEIDGFWFSKYQNVVQNDRAYSLPCEIPHVYVNADQAATYCANKGKGWASITAMEWGAIALWCKKNGFLPYGNNCDGSVMDYREECVKAIPVPYDPDEDPTMCYTGTGPLTWSHDKTPGGIWDLNGNVYEWVLGLRFVYGEVQILKDNNAADSRHSMAANSSEWKAIDATTGGLITPNGSGTTTNSVKLNNNKKYTKNAITKGYVSGSFADLSCDSTICAKAKELLIALAICPDGSEFDYEAYFYCNTNEAERFVCRGGNWNDGGNAGVFKWDGRNGRDYSNDRLGFRSAFIEELATED